MENMNTHFTDSDTLQILSENFPSFFESEDEEFLVKGEKGLTDYVFVRPNSSAYHRLVNEKVVMFTFQDKDGRLVFWYPIAPEA